jgi:exopolysaccharide biosynthesis polyprenyl glycosylphosphotransferase
VTAVDHPGVLGAEDLRALVGPRTLEVLEGRRAGRRLRRRGWLVRRMLLAADLVGVATAFALAEILIDGRGPLQTAEWWVLPAILPVWILTAKIYGLYDRDEERAAHTTVDDVVGVFHLVTVGVWLLLLAGRVSGAANPEFVKVAGFWLMAIVLVTAARAAARSAARRSVLYVQNMVVVGAGDVGQLIARKAMLHPEYGINVVGFVDGEPREMRRDLAPVPLLGPPDRLADVVRLFDVDRVVVAFSREPAAATLEIVRSLHELDVQIDVVPRLFDIVGPKMAYHTIEALPLLGLPPVRPSRSALAAKRLIDIAGAGAALLVTAPLLAAIALRIRLDGDGPVLFRQTRLGVGMREFTALKFRTMRVGGDDGAHREYIRRTMSASAAVEANGVFKLDRPDAITPVGRWLRRTSLDELPQLINVLRGDMSLVGPRPCIPYETEQFKPYHFERFLVPAGITGLWQVAARANSTFGEALDMDVNYARSWSLGLDLRLLCQTPLQVLRQRGAV